MSRDPGPQDLGLEELIAPIAPQEFFDRYWERQHLHLARSEPGFYRDVFTLEDVDRWVAASARHAEPCVVIKPSGGGPPVRSGTPGEVPLEALYEGFGAGHSIIIQGLQHSWAPLLPVMARLEEAFSARVGVNLYLSPAGSTVFARHSDYHDFFIFQIDGAKEWFLYESDYLPMEHLEHGQVLPEFRSRTRSETPLRQQLRLEAGDLLYVPRGMPHHASAVDTHSLHLTVSFHPRYWVDFLKAAVEEVGVRDQRLQQALPPGFLSRPELREPMRQVFAECLATLHAQASFDATWAALTEKLIRTPRPFADGHLAQLVRLEELSQDSALERRPGMECRLEVAGDQAVIRYGAGELRGPAALRTALEYVRDHRCFRVRDLPGLTEAARLTLVRRLVRGGLLRVGAW